ncbi:MAG: DUF4349 domain-containing protein [Clostridiales bacterium]|nr:DUF4349 domain-containing protein [Clostridiales bacterium]
MTCNDYELLLDQYLSDGLSEVEQTIFEGHLNTCASCRFKLTVLQDSRSLDEDSEVPASFTSAWQQRIKEEANPVKQGNKLIRWLSVAAVMVLLIGGTYLTGLGRRYATVSSEPTAATGYGMSAPAGSQPMMEEAKMSMRSVGDMAEAAPASAQAKSPEKIIRTVSMELSTRTFDEDRETIKTLVTQAGGRIEQSRLYTLGSNLRRQEMTLRVPSNQLDSITSSIKSVGRMVYFTESAEDVSERYADTANRLKTQQTKMERLQALLAKAESVEDLITLENSISDTQYELDRLTGQLHGMDSKVDYATLALTLNELGPIDTSKDQEESLLERIKNGMSAAFTEFTYVMSDLVVFLFVALPYILALILVIILIRLLIKRRKNK